MGRTVASILRPWGASFVGVLVVLCIPSQAAHASSSGTPLLRPDAPPTGAVVAPAPDAPATAERQPSVGQGAPVVRPTLQRAPVSVTPRAVTTRTTRRNNAPAKGNHAPAKAHVVAAPRTVSKQQPPAHRAILLRRGLPDAVGAFLATPLAMAADDGIDRGALALAGILLGIVTLGGGCLTLVVGRVAQER